MAMRTSLAWLALVTLWLCVVESQDGVEPLSLLELQDAPSGADSASSASMSIMQKVMGDMAIQSQEKQVENEELSTDAAVNKAELDKRVADGDAKLKTEAKEQEKEKEPVDETQLAPVVKTGLKELDAVNKENMMLRERIERAQADQDSLEEKSFHDNMAKVTFEIKEKYEEKRQANPVQPEFKMIPFFMYKSLAKKVPAANKEECEKVCATQRKCKSFTWVSNPHECWWSVGKLKYHDDYIYAAKVTEPEAGEPNKKWNETPGLEWVTPISKNEYKISFDECKDICWKEGLACAAVSYKQNTRTCIRGSEALPTDEHAKYYEKLETELDVQEKDQVEKEQNKLTSNFKAKETAMKAEQKEQEEKVVRETAQKKSAREIYTKQLPRPGDERKMKLKVEQQVAETKMKLEAEKVKQQQKKQEKRNSVLAKRKAERLTKLHKIHVEQEKSAQEVKKLHAALEKEGTKMAAFEKAATDASNTLEDKLAAVSTDHKSAMEALMAFNEIKGKKDADPAAAAAARIAMQESHTKLSGSIGEAEFAHTKEVKRKKQLKAAEEDEAHASEAYQDAKQKADNKKEEDQIIIVKLKKEGQDEAEQQARDVYNVEKANFKNLKTNEAAEKKQQAVDEAKEKVLEMKFNNAKGEISADLTNQLTTAKEVNHKAKNALQNLAAEFKENLKSMTHAKEAYEKLHVTALNREKKNQQSQNEALLQSANAKVAGVGTAEL